MFKQTKRVLATAALMALVACNPQMHPATPSPTAAESYTVYTTSNAAPLVESLLSHYNESLSEELFRYDVGNHGQLLAGLGDNELDYFVSHHRPNDDDIWAAPIAQDGIVAIVHADNAITNLTTALLRQIYQGFITNWAELGGENITITLYSREAGSAVRAEFDRLVMGQRVTSPNAQIVPSTQAAILSITEDRGGLAYIPLSQLTSQVHALSIDDIPPTQDSVAQQIYPLRSTLFIIGREEPKEPYAALISWIQSTVGQNIVSEHYIPLPR
ncbi:substrate-binding domain-containing protein [Phototrophicus methaneseepsis]|uniref:Substrate-binding domain-containing protein n=1 Tax=Phototrophicus methaneseepsis TaxID=2710758 RepID=A0A7S8E7I3_9CHLR|nr:substrate-binding domain-containing protein [Phototrophicus methaneseepsis]QPC81801.1 substrate-binding domain-containing protein [Phototrophicus methaneseepsis]